MSGKKTRNRTALTQYARLESSGLWRETASAQRREVIVAFREATLVLTDPRKDEALSHWSLPAIERVNPGILPAVFSPGTDADETLEIDDADMIDALERVRSAVKSLSPQPGRLRSALFAGGTTLVLLMAGLWLPDALIKHTASVLPSATREAIGQLALSDMQRLTGSPCETPLGTFALTELGDKLFGPHRARILVVREGVQSATHLPGGVIIVGRRIVEEQQGPDLLAGFALMERLRAEAEDPILPVLRHAGLIATFRLLTSGTLPEQAIAGYGQTLLQRTPVGVPVDVALARFKAAGVTSTPLAQALDPTGETTKALIEGDPMKGLVPTPLIADGDWVSLQDICLN